MYYLSKDNNVIIKLIIVKKGFVFLSVFVVSGFVLQSAINIKETQIMRFGFTASRKIGGAVKRNRAKRSLEISKEERRNDKLDSIKMKRSRMLLKTND